MYDVVDPNTGKQLATGRDMTDATAKAAFYAQALKHNTEIHAPDGVYTVKASPQL